MNMFRKKHLANQDGFAAIVISLILIIVLALLTVGFAQLARREQQGALDKQLANQAYYAAESGVNDAIKLIKTTSSPSFNDQCYPQTGVLSGQNNVGPTGSGASYSCILINTSPKEIVYNNVPPNTQRPVVFTTDSAITTLTISWKNTTPPTDNFKASLPAVFKAINNWGSGVPAVLQVGLTPLPSLYNRDDLISNTFNVYGYPVDKSNAPNNLVIDGSINQGAVISGACDKYNPGYACSITIDNIPTPSLSLGATKYSYLLRILDYYTASDISISAKAGNTQLQLQNAQAVIDSTGKSRDVLKRIQVRVPLQNLGGPLVPGYALEAGDICKRIEARPITNNTNNNTYFINTTGSKLGTASLDPCNIEN